MCSLHPRIAKKILGMIEDAASHISGGITDNDILLIKQAKRKGADEMGTIKECVNADRYLKIFNSPTPNARNVAQVLKHLEDLTKELRR